MPRYSPEIIARVRAQARFLGRANEDAFFDEIETKGELFLYSPFYGEFRYYRTGPGTFQVEHVKGTPIPDDTEY